MPLQMAAGGTLQRGHARVEIGNLMTVLPIL
jgi:hypothetical protein